MLRSGIARLLLAALNSRWLNQTPCEYALVNNLDSFSRSDIEFSLKEKPDMSLREYLDAADRFKACPISRVGVTAIEPDGTYTQNVDFR